MNRVYNYTLDPCGPVYITVGDGGNIEKIDIDHADDPEKCPSQSDNVPEFGGVCHLNFSSGPAKGRFCWAKQPEWSAFRESSFGHGILEVCLLRLTSIVVLKLFVWHFNVSLQVINSSYALWTWHRNQDVYKENSKGDQIYIVRQPELCLPRIEKVTSQSRWEQNKHNNSIVNWNIGYKLLCLDLKLNRKMSMMCKLI